MNKRLIEEIDKALERTGGVIERPDFPPSNVCCGITGKDRIFTKTCEVCMIVSKEAEELLCCQLTCEEQESTCPHCNDCNKRTIWLMSRFKARDKSYDRRLVEYNRG